MPASVQESWQSYLQEKALAIIPTSESPAAKFTRAPTYLEKLLSAITICKEMTNLLHINTQTITKRQQIVSIMQKNTEECENR